MAHFIPCTKTITGVEIAKLFFNNIYFIYGLPNDIVSDRELNLLPISGEDFFSYLV
jgi:hypothetical protein